MSASARLLRLVSLLSTRPSWTNRELADRLGVTERTVRRDVAKLRELGYGVESDAGPWGGYRLGQAGAVPPLNLDDEEAFAVAVALQEAARTGLLGDDRAALSALFKLQRLLPRRVADRLGAFAGALVHTPRAAGDPVSAAVLAELAGACRTGERLRLAYRDREGRATVREVDPYRLVRTAHRWYLVAEDVARGQWRTFRADRVEAAHGTGRTTEIVDPPDAAKLVADMLTSDYPVYATIRLPVPAERARQLVPPGAGVHEPDGERATLVTMGGTSLEDLATRLLRLASPLRVVEPEELRAVLRRRMAELSDQL